MPLPSSLADLSPTAGSNSPSGSESPTTTDDYLRAHASFLAMLRDARVPVGGICMYDGLIADLPPNWKVCDGTNGTPDLRDKFIVGAGASYALGAIGGSKDSVVVAHTHGFNGATGTESAFHTHGVNDPGHSHSTVSGGANSGTGAYADATPRNNVSTSVSATGISLGTESALHTHPFSGTTNSAGVSGTNANLPPYYALVYIKRLS